MNKQKTESIQVPIPTTRQRRSRRFGSLTRQRRVMRVLERAGVCKLKRVRVNRWGTIRLTMIAPPSSEK